MRLGLGRRELASKPSGPGPHAAYLQELTVRFKRANLIADIVSPRIKVPKQSDKYRIFGKNTMIVHERGGRRARSRTPSPSVGRKTPFYADIRKLRGLVLDTERRNRRRRARSRAADDGRGHGMRDREPREARRGSVHHGGNYGATHKITKSGGSEWDSATALGELAGAARHAGDDPSRRHRRGVPTTELTVVIPEPVYLVGAAEQCGHPRTACSTRRRASSRRHPEDAAQREAGDLLGDDERRRRTRSRGFRRRHRIHEHVSVGRHGVGWSRSPTTNQDDPSFSRSFNWTAETGGQERQIRKYRAEDEGREGDWIECKEAIGEKIVVRDRGRRDFQHAVDHLSAYDPR
jgi:hypothetical protein